MSAMLSDFLEDYEAERIAAMNTPEALAEEAAMSVRASARQAREFDRRLAAGEIDQDGNCLLPQCSECEGLLAPDGTCPDCDDEDD